MSVRSNKAFDTDTQRHCAAAVRGSIRLAGRLVYDPARFGRGIRIHAFGAALSVIVPAVLWNESRSCVGCVIAVPVGMFVSLPVVFALFIWAEKSLSLKL